MSGLELARQAKSYSPGLQVVFATGDQAAALEAGDIGASLLVKPYGADRLQDIFAGLRA